MLHTVLLQIVENTVEQHMSLYKKYFDSENPILLVLQFTLVYTFSESKELHFFPTIETFHDQLMNLLIQLETSIRDLPAVNLPMFDIDPNTVSFDDCVNCAKTTQQDLEETLEKHFSELQKFLETYKHLEPTLSLTPESFSGDFDSNGEKTLVEYRNQLGDFYRATDCIQIEMREEY